MWKYITKFQCNEFLLSLDLIDDKLVDKLRIRKLYSISNNIENNYRVYKIKKSNGMFRIVYEPNFSLKYIQRQILKNILEEKKISNYAKAYCKSICLKDNALPHVNKKIVLKLDIKDFFDHIRFFDIYNSCFSLAYFPKSVGMLLTHLCTYQGHLPQGAPTSAYISNLVLKEFDEELGNWCKERNISYTRYSDDMTFSGDFYSSELIRRVRKMLYRLGFELNDDKICVIRNSSKQIVTGVIVNNKLQVDKTYRKRIRQEIYYIKKFGINSHLNQIGCKNKKQYLISLRGRILFVLQIDEHNLEFIHYKDTVNQLINELY